LQQKYHYDRQQRFAQEQAEQQPEGAVRKRAPDEAVIRNNAHILREVRSDQRSFLDKPFITEGKIDVADDYSCSNRDAERTHYSFELRTQMVGVMRTGSATGQLPFVSDLSRMVAL